MFPIDNKAHKEWLAALKEHARQLCPGEPEKAEELYEQMVEAFGDVL